jgi:signal peptidase I
VTEEPPTRAVPGAGPQAGVVEHRTDLPGGVVGPDAPAPTGDGHVPAPSPGGPGGSDGATGTSGPGGGGGDGEGGSGAPRRQRSARRWLVEWIVIILVAVGVAFGVRTYVAQTYYVPSTSMWPTLKAGDRIVVNKLYGTIHVGDIIVFRRPPAEHCGGSPVPDLVKRVIGLPGQTVSAAHGEVYITGKPLKQPWLPQGPQRTTSMSTKYKVPAGDYFVMGDNRVNSCDSRMWGPVKSSYIVGKVFLILWPLSQFRFF